MTLINSFEGAVRWYFCCMARRDDLWVRMCIVLLFWVLFFLLQRIHGGFRLLRPPLPGVDY